MHDVQTILNRIVFIILLLASNKMLAFENYDEIAVNTFWNELYSGGGWSLYCGFKFTNAHDLSDGHLFVIEQIYPVSWMLRALNCDSRMQCRNDKNSRYTVMEADMHNLYPVWQDTDVLRRDTYYGIIEGEDWRYKDCDFERRAGITEPRPIARGNIARAIFYMHTQYGVPIDAGMLDTLKRWNRDDPPSNQEVKRNDRIEELQGNRNRYIDNPTLAEQLSSKWLSTR